MTGARSPAVDATSTKWALNGRPEGAGLAKGLAAWIETPSPSSRAAVAEIAEPRQSRTNVRRVKVITEPALRNEVVGREFSIIATTTERVKVSAQITRAPSGRQEVHPPRAGPDPWAGCPLRPVCTGCVLAPPL